MQTPELLRPSLKKKTLIRRGSLTAREAFDNLVNEYLGDDNQRHAKREYGKKHVVHSHSTTSRSLALALVLSDKSDGIKNCKRKKKQLSLV